MINLKPTLRKIDSFGDESEEDEEEKKFKK